MTEIKIGKISFTGDASLADLETIFADLHNKGYVMKTNAKIVSSSIWFNILKEIDV